MRYADRLDNYYNPNKDESDWDDPETLTNEDMIEELLYDKSYRKVRVIENDEIVIPDKAGVYFLLDEKSNVVYVGQSKYLMRRLNSHHINRNITAAEGSRFCKFYYFFVTDRRERVFLEKVFIGTFRPKENIKDNPYYDMDKKDASEYLSVETNPRYKDANYLYSVLEFAGLESRFFDLAQFFFNTRVYGRWARFLSYDFEDVEEVLYHKEKLRQKVLDAIKDAEGAKYREIWNKNMAKERRSK